MFRSFKTIGVNEFLVHTGQHFDENMSKVFFDEMGISNPQANLGVSGGTHGAMTGEMLIEVEKLMIEQKPDWVLVYGDTNSTLAGSIAASKLSIPCAHVEAGLRSDSRKMPEELTEFLPIMHPICYLLRLKSYLRTSLGRDSRKGRTGMLYQMPH